MQLMPLGGRIRPSLCKVLILLKVESVNTPHMSRPVEMRAGCESGDGDERGSKAEGREKASRPQSSVRPSDGDLRWVPPWLSRLKNRPKRGIPLLPSVRLIVNDVGSWGCAAGLRNLKAKSQMHHSKGIIVRSFELEVSDLPKISTFPTNVCLQLRFAISWINLLPVVFLMLRVITFAEALTLGVLYLALYEWVLWYIWPLGRVFYKSKSRLQEASTLMELARKNFIWVRVQMCELNCINRDFATIPKIGYAWSRVSVCVGMVKFLTDLLSIECAIDRHLRIIGLRLFSMSICAVHHWSNVCLFSVLLNTVHCQGRHVPVQCLWIYCSSLDWGSISLSCCLFDCASFNIMINVLLEYFLVPRNLVRNPSCRCVPREADLAARWVAKASLEWSCPVVRVFRPPFLLQFYAVYGAKNYLAMYLIYHCNRDLLIICFSRMLGRFLGLFVYCYPLLALVCLNSGFKTLYFICF